MLFGLLQTYCLIFRVLKKLVLHFFSNVFLLWKRGVLEDPYSTIPGDVTLIVF